MPQGLLQPPLYLAIIGVPPIKHGVLLPLPCVHAHEVVDDALLLVWLPVDSFGAAAFVQRYIKYTIVIIVVLRLGLRGPSPPAHPQFRLPSLTTCCSAVRRRVRRILPFPVDAREFEDLRRGGRGDLRRVLPLICLVFVQWVSAASLCRHIAYHYIQRTLNLVGEPALHRIFRP